MKNNPNLLDNYERQWNAKFNELCYEVFYNNALGQQLLLLLENRYFRSPVASPGLEPPWAYFNEGRNELIRAFTSGIQAHIHTNHVKEKHQPLPRRAKVKPMPNVSNEG